MKKNKINFDLRHRVLKYMEFFREDVRIQDDEENELISQLSNNLKEELLLDANGSTIKSMPMFSLNFSEDTLRKLVNCIKIVRYHPGEIIYLVILHLF